MESSTALWLSASSTSLASAVALFGPTVRSWWARPVITLHKPEDTLLNNDELIMVSPVEGEEDERLKFVLLDVTNHGRTQLEELEAVLTAHQRIQPDADTDPDESFPAFDLPVVSRGLLQFEFASADRPRITVPPGATRSLRLAFLAPDAEARRELARRKESSAGDAVRVCGRVGPAAF